jgi:hypothetical protein
MCAHPRAAPPPNASANLFFAMVVTSRPRQLGTAMDLI